MFTQRLHLAPQLLVAQYLDQLAQFLRFRQPPWLKRLLAVGVHDTTLLMTT
jgi:hypothetical protein